MLHKKYSVFNFLLSLSVGLYICLFTQICFLAAMPAKAFAASFDCAAASDNVEKMICADKELSELDDKLAVAYKKALNRARDKQTLKVLQQQWLKNLRQWCRDQDCMKIFYRNRLSWLNSYSDAKFFDIPPQVPGKYKASVPLCCVKNNEVEDNEQGKDTAENILNINLITKRLAYTEMAFVSPNGNTCGFEGYGTWNGSKLIVKKEQPNAPEINCTVELMFVGNMVVVTAIGNECNYYCGLNATFDDIRLTKATP